MSGREPSPGDERSAVDLAGYLTARLGPLAFVLLIVVAVSAPLAYLVMGTQTVRTRATATANLVAELIQEEAQQRPVLWRYDAPKLLRSLDQQAEHASIVRIDVTDEHGHWMDFGQAPPSDDDRALLWASAPIRLDREIARVWVGVTTHEVERQALLLLIGFSMLGAALAGMMYWLPRVAIVQAERRVAASQGALAELNQTLEAQVVERSSQLAAALQEVRDKEQRLRELSGRAVALQEAERRSLSRELHDSAGQALTAVRINLQLLGSMATTDATRGLAERTVALADATLEEIRRVVDRLAPAVLADLGLQRAIERHCDDFAERTGVEIDYACSGLDRPGVDTGVETAAYRIVQESLTNIARHAEAERVVIRMARVGGTPGTLEPDRIVLDVVDDGRGFDVGVVRSKGRRGLEGMRERVELVGGSITIRPAAEWFAAVGEPRGAGQGTHIHVELPVQPIAGEAGSSA